MWSVFKLITNYFDNWLTDFIVLIWIFSSYFPKRPIKYLSYWTKQDIWARRLGLWTTFSAILLMIDFFMNTINNMTINNQSCFYRKDLLKYIVDTTPPPTSSYQLTPPPPLPPPNTHTRYTPTPALPSSLMPSRSSDLTLGGSLFFLLLYAFLPQRLLHTRLFPITYTQRHERRDTLLFLPLRNTCMLVCIQYWIVLRVTGFIGGQDKKL